MSDVTRMERLIKASPDVVWDLWTTPAGIESWWGPQGFVTTVHVLDLKVGGVLDYTFTASTPDLIAGMKAANLPTESRVTATYKVIEPKKRATWATRVDFIQGIEPYPVDTTIELVPEAKATRLTVSFGAMHDPVWTKRMCDGWEQELAKLEAQVARRQG